MFLVTRLRSGPRWDVSLPLEQQDGWAAPAPFTEELVERGVVLLGGPWPSGHGAAGGRGRASATVDLAGAWRRSPCGPRWAPTTRIPRLLRRSRGKAVPAEER